MSGPLEIRVVVDEADVAAWVDIRNRVDRVPTTVVETVFFRGIDKGRRDHLAVSDGRVVGNASTMPLPNSPSSDVGELIVRVPAEERCRGVGTALFEEGRRFLRESAKATLQTTVPAEDEGAIAFAANRGFVEHSRNLVVALDLTTFDPAEAPPPPGIELTDLARRPDLVRGFYELDIAASVDIPGEDQAFERTFEEAVALLDKPGVDRSLITLAVTTGGEVVGSAMLVRLPADPTMSFHWLTAVRRDWRGRGVATAVKRAQLAAAKATGVRVARTYNEVRNEPMRRLNDRLGYEREPDSIIMRAPLEQA